MLDAHDAVVPEVVVPMTRAQVIERIMSLNPSAPSGYLDGFSDGALREYLDHLTASLAPRGPEARWVRRAATPAIVAHESPE